MTRDQRDLRAACRDLTPDVVRLWQHTIRDPDAKLSDRLTAAQQAMDRGHGRPRQDHQIDAGPTLLELILATLPTQ